MAWCFRLGYSFLWREGIRRYFPSLMLWSDFLRAAETQSVILTANRPVETHYLYWQINDSRWNQECILSHRQVFSLRRRDVPLKHYAGCLSSISVTVRAGEREIGKSLYIVGKMPPSQFLQAYFPHSYLVFLPRAGFWAKMCCIPALFFAQCVEKKLILPLKHVWLLIFIPLMLWFHVEMNTKMDYNFLSIYFITDSLYYIITFFITIDSDYHKQASVPKLLKDFKVH